MNPLITKADECVNIGHNLSYFNEREILLDCRGDLEISPSSNWGFRCMVLTSTHDIHGNWERIIRKKVVVKDRAWICSGAILYNCVIGEDAIVGVGAVVRNITVPPYCAVLGNPAQIVERYVDGKWHREINGYNISGSQSEISIRLEGEI